MSSHVLSIDLGGTQIRSAVVERDGRLLSRTRTATPHSTSPDAGIQALLQTAHAALAQSPSRDIAGIGLSAVGPINPRTGIMYAPPNVSGWTEVPIGAIVAREFSLPCFAGNDANLAALAEYRFGAGQGSQDII